MAVSLDKYKELIHELNTDNVKLVAVSKTKPASDIAVLYKEGQRDFGENYVQEMVAKSTELPSDIRWHFIGHLQSNKVKYIAPFVHLIHGIDSIKLLQAVNKQGEKLNRKIHVLLQIHIAREETKFGFDENELDHFFRNKLWQPLEHVIICGFMGMASFSNDKELIRSEFRKLNYIFEKYRTAVTKEAPMTVLSMGMTNDYKIAIQEGSTMVRIGSLLFGERK